MGPAAGARTPFESVDLTHSESRFAARVGASPVRQRGVLGEASVKSRGMDPAIRSVQLHGSLILQTQSDPSSGKPLRNMHGGVSPSA